MTEEEQRHEVAKLDGWQFDGRDTWTDPSGVECQALYGDCDKYGDFVPPNYTADLNAMHGVVAKVIDTLDLKIEFRFHLQRITSGQVAKPGGYVPHYKRQEGTNAWFKCVHATAAQHAEAVLRTFNKWKD
jgi:hypothetical protein